MTTDSAPWHAHIYYSAEERSTAAALREMLQARTKEEKEFQILFVGGMTDAKAGPHPLPQFEVHFLGGSLAAVRASVRASGLRALVHPLTDDDLADHTNLAHWIGEPVELDLTVLDPPGRNQGVARFGKSDF